MVQQSSIIEIFCCYARKDKDLLDELKTHLSPLQRQKTIRVWYDGDISAGIEWDREIKQHLNNAKIILLLVSPDFIASEYCYGIEMKHALERHKRKEARVIPIILRPLSGWEKVPPGDIHLGQLQALPKNAQPVTSWTNTDEAWKGVAEGIERVTNELLSEPLMPQSTQPSNSLTPVSIQKRVDRLPLHPSRGRTLILALLTFMLVIASGGGSWAVWYLTTHHPPTTSTTRAPVVPSLSSYDQFVAKNGVQFGFDAAHTGYNPYERILSSSNISRIVPLWTFTTRDGVFSSPVVAGGMVYVGSDNHNLYVFDAACRKACQPLWTFTAKDSVFSSPAVAGGMVYVSSQDHNLYVFDATCRKSCQPLWTFVDQYPLNTSPVVAGGMVYVSSNNLYAFDATCRSMCQAQASFVPGGTSFSFFSSPAIANGMIYVGSSDHKLYAFDARCSNRCLPLWTFATDDLLLSSPVVAGGMVYVGSQDHKFYVFDATCRSACQPLWTFVTKNQIADQPAVARGMVYLGADDGKLYVFDAACRNACQPLWIYDNGASASSPVVAGSVVYVLFADGNLYAFDAACRKICPPRATLSDRGDSLPAIADGILYLGSDRQFQAFGLSS